MKVTKSYSLITIIMFISVLENCLVHALYQTLKYQEWKQNRTIENLNEYRNSVRKTYKRPGFCPEVYNAVNNMKEVKYDCDILLNKFLFQRAGMTKSSDFDRLDIEQFQKTIFASTHQIVVFVENSTTPYYMGPYVGPSKQLVLYLSNGHFSGVRSICALLKTEYYCFLCNTKYNNTSSHYNCPLIHRVCGQKSCTISNEDEEVRCNKCTIKFRSRLCFENHLKNGNKI